MNEYNAMRRATVNWVAVGIALMLGLVFGAMSAWAQGETVILMITSANKPSTNQVFLVYSSTTLSVPVTNWLVLTNANNTQTNLELAAGPLSVERYFSVVESNKFWRTNTGFSAVVTQPAWLAVPPGLGIARGQ